MAIEGASNDMVRACFRQLIAEMGRAAQTRQVLEILFELYNRDPTIRMFDDELAEHMGFRMSPGHVGNSKSSERAAVLATREKPAVYTQRQSAEPVVFTVVTDRDGG